MSLKKALVIAIQNYPIAEDLGPQLPNTIQAAEEFYQWLIGPKGLKAEDVTICCDEGNFVAHPRLGTTRSTIIDDAITPLIDTWRDKDPSNFELFIFFSGHGLGFQQSFGKRAVDALVCSDYVNRQKGDACMQFSELQEKLYFSLGGAHHYYFIDACRTILSADEIDIPSFGRNYAPARLGSPTRYTLYSTAYGQPALINSGFAPALIRGLHGEGHAKGWVGADMYVTFDLLCQYVRNSVTQLVDPKREGPGDGFVLRLSPTPTSACAVQVLNSNPQDEFELVANWQGLKKVHTFKGTATQWQLPPNYYDLQLLHNTKPLVRVQPPWNEQVDLYDNNRAVYDKSTPVPDSGKAAGVEVAEFSVAAPAHTEVRLRNLGTGETSMAMGSRVLTTIPGLYTVRVMEAGEPISISTLEFSARDNLVHDVSAGSNKVHAAILKGMGEPIRPVSHASESLGPIANRDPGLWLALAGAAHLSAAPGRFHAFAALPLETFADVQPNTSVLYVLASSERNDRAPAIRIGSGQRVWRSATSVGGVGSVYQLKDSLKIGPLLVSLRFPGSEITTYASYALPNRATFLVVNQDEDGGLAVQQYLLPLHHLKGEAPPEVGVWLDDWRLLRWIRYSCGLQKRFAQKRALAPTADVDDEAKLFWHEVLQAKWVDPIVSLLGAYETFRRGSELGRQELRLNVENLRRLAPGLPDTEVIASMIDLEHSTPAAPPLILQGVLLLPNTQDALRLAVGKLNFDSMWTSWRSGPG